MPESTSLPLLKGTLDLLILKTLSWGPMHGYAIASWLEQRSSGELGVDDSALYQALQRMETRELISAEWGVTSTGRKARFYRLTTRGRQHLKDEAAIWQRYTRSVSSILALASRGPKEA
jgi:transcriptional regulator